MNIAIRIAAKEASTSSMKMPSVDVYNAESWKNIHVANSTLHAGKCPELLALSSTMAFRNIAEGLNGPVPGPETLRTLQESVVYR